MTLGKQLQGTPAWQGMVVEDIHTTPDAGDKLTSEWGERSGWKGRGRSASIRYHIKRSFLNRSGDARNPGEVVTRDGGEIIRSCCKRHSLDP